MSEDVRTNSDDQILTFIQRLPNGRFRAGFAIDDPEEGLIVHRQTHDTLAEARQAEAELQADLFYCFEH
jgi:hypothetical protein